MLAVLPPHAASGATLTWKRLPDREALTFRFERQLPTVEPRQRGLTRVQLPIPENFWQREGKPSVPDFKRSALLRDVSISPDGVFILTSTEDFLFSFSSDPRRKTLTIDFYPPPREEPPAETGTANSTGPGDAKATSPTSNATETPGNPANATGVNASVESGARANATEPNASLEHNASMPTNASLTPESATAGDASEENGSSAASAPHEPSPGPPAGEPPGTPALRARVVRPDPGGRAATQAQSRVRRTVDRNATMPVPEIGDPGNATIEHEIASHASPPAMGGEAAVNATASDASSSTRKDEDAANATMPSASEEPSPGAISPADASTPTARQLPPTRAEADRETKPATSPAEAVPVAQDAVVNASPSEAGPAVAGNGADASTGNVSMETQLVFQDNATVDLNGTDSVNASGDNATAELEDLYGRAQKALMARDLEGADRAVRDMLNHPKTPENLREELLYTLADIALQKGKDDLAGNFTVILDAYTAAMLANPRSPSTAEALSRIAFLHLQVGNEPEAKGYFDLLRRTFPDDPRASMIDHHWGEHYLRRKDYARAAEHFQYVLQNHPGSKAVLPSTVGLLKAFTELGFFDKALGLVDRIEARWPAYHLSDPSFLMAAGYAASLSGSLDRARDYFWTYVNIVPQAPDADVALARIGDIHVKQGRLDAAREIYQRTVEQYPDREGALIAQMRLAEEGILDQPSMADMDLVFSRPESNPGRIYNRILEHADSPLAPVARLKLAMWHLWGRKYAESLDDVHRFEQDHPNHELRPKAREVADKALRDWIMHGVEKEDFESVVTTWLGHAHLFQERELDPQTRLAVATAFMKTGRTGPALDMAKPFVFGSLPRTAHSEPGLDLTLALLVEQQLWPKIIDLSKSVSTWGLGLDRQRQVDYATALAHEKLDQPARAKPLWTKLATDLGLTETQRGYAHYFLGRAALADGDTELATILGQEALGLLRKDKDDIPKLKESLELLIQAADRSGRPQEALAWSLEYDGHVARDDADWPAHTYRKAILFRKNGDMGRWRENLDHLKELFPNTLYGRMAAAELEGQRLEREVGKFR